MKLRRRTFAVAAVASALLGGAAIVAAQPTWETGERRRAVGDWLVEDVVDPGHGWDVSLRREGDEYSLSYLIRLNALQGGSPVEIYEVVRLNCGQGGGAAIEGGRNYGERDRVRAQLVEYLVRCELPPEEAETALEDFERAFALAAGWADERAVEMAANHAAGSSEGEMSTDMSAMDMTMDMNAADMDVMTDTNFTADMDMSMDTNTTDMNWTADPDASTNALAPQ